MHGGGQLGGFTRPSAHSRFGLHQLFLQVSPLSLCYSRIQWLADRRKDGSNLRLSKLRLSWEVLCSMLVEQPLGISITSAFRREQILPPLLPGQWMVRSNPSRFVVLFLAPPQRSDRYADIARFARPNAASIKIGTL